MLNYSFTLQDVGVHLVLLGHENVVKRVVWNITCTDSEDIELQLSWNIETVLDTTNLQNFVSIQNLTKDQILDWAFTTAGGQTYLDNLRPTIEQRMRLMKAKKETVNYDLSLFP